MHTLKLHRYIVGWVGLFIACSVTLPLAMLRVSKTEKFAEQPFNSLTCEGQIPGSRSVTKFFTCAQMQVQPVAHNAPQPGTIPAVADKAVAIKAETQPVTSTPLIDPFAEAFRIAEQAVDQGRMAKTSADWHHLVPQWQQAAELMSRVLPEDPRYATAQQRVAFYQQNQRAVLKQAERMLP
jgi:hypothetical protein